MDKISKFLLLFVMAVLSFTACSDDDDLPWYNSTASSIRDGRYEGGRCTVYIDGKEKSNISLIFVSSENINSSAQPDKDGFIYNTRLMIKGLEKKGKYTIIQGRSTLDEFVGSITLKGVEYNVTAEFIGHPFETHVDEFKIVVYLTSNE